MKTPTVVSAAAEDGECDGDGKQAKESPRSHLRAAARSIVVQVETRMFHARTWKPLSRQHARCFFWKMRKTEAIEPKNFNRRKGRKDENALSGNSLRFAGHGGSGLTRSCDGKEKRKGKERKGKERKAPKGRL